ncbi:hypothetical protein Ahy_A09g042161 isoform A [Arachis hypogaea]|uniref:Urease accessory protein UreF n=1 Tax=Arachis hypogaea TaxID=3818 RepID=A0A445BF33_ARAHY|nr:hypothetical protein Ahy_A09g042161 isoform A [Arachis hypogaea]
MAILALSLLTMVRFESGSFNGLPPPRSPKLTPHSHISLTKPSWVVRTESNVKKKRRKKPDPHCVVCEGSGRVDCHQCRGKGRTNQVHLEMLPKGEWPKWCRTCGGSGLGYCSRCLGTGEYRYIMGFHFMNRDDDKSQENNEGCDNGPRLADSIAQWSQWQLLDSLLPTGGFAHSFGLEAAVQSNLVSNPDELKTFIIHVLENTGSLLLPFVHLASVSPKLETWHNLDKILDATLTNEVSRKASISQGSALMRVGSAVFSELPSLKTMRNASLGSGTISFHHAPIFGLICGTLGLDSTDSQRAYMYITMRDVISAATRLNLIGPLGAAVLQHQLAPNAEAILEKWKNRDVDDACQVAPLLDTVQGCHGYLFSRLFSS